MAVIIKLSAINEEDKTRTINVTNEKEIIEERSSQNQVSSSPGSSAAGSPTMINVTHTILRTTELEDIDFDENFSDDEDSSQIILEKKTVHLLASLEDSEEDDDDDE